MYATVMQKDCDTEHEAVLEACKEVKEYLLEHKRASSPDYSHCEIDNYSPKLMRLLDDLMRPKAVQLSLF